MSSSDKAASRPPRWLAILLVSLAGLLLEVGYTRVVSFKLWYYYTYLVIGLSLLGIGSGGILVAIWGGLKRAATERIIALASLAGAVSVAVGFVVVAVMPINTYNIWDYGTNASSTNMIGLSMICLALLPAFVAIGVVVATLLGRAGDQVGRVYFADLVGAGFGCLLAVPLNALLGPPAVIALAGLILAVTGLLWLPRRRSPLVVAGLAVTLTLAVSVVFDDQVIPDVRAEDTKTDLRESSYGEWGPVFRVDVSPPRGPDHVRVLSHDGTYGSALWEFDGDVESLTRFDNDSRAIPFRVLDDPPERELIIGSAGGNEILASLYFDAPRIEAVELNPVTVSLLNDRYADLTGHLPDRPEVDLTVGDGRSYLARHDDDYDLVWFVATDSYAATNAASFGAFVLSESYLYTTEMVEETLDHLTDDGIMVVQFGELDISQPNRTSRYIVTARHALEAMGVRDPGQHVLVSAQTQDGGAGLSTIVVKRTPFTAAEVDRFSDGLDEMSEGLAAEAEEERAEEEEEDAETEEARDSGEEEQGSGDQDERDWGEEEEETPEHLAIYAPGGPSDDSTLAELAGGSRADVDSIVDDHPRDISAVTDDAPFFWHFSSFGSVVADFFEPIDIYLADPEVAIGERVLLLLLVIAAVYAAAFLLLPFVTVRRRWSALPAKPTSAVYFACLGLGFMLYEITMIQRLVRFLGYPTYSLTVTLASILVSTGVGALLSPRLARRPRVAMPGLLGVLAVLTLFYQLGLDPLADALLSQSLAVRVVFALVVLAPLGLCLGMFMPLGLGLVTQLTEDGESYSAWSWAINGFFSVIGSVLTTILSMMFGFDLVQYLALATYAIAVVVFLRLLRHRQLEVTVVDMASPGGAETAPVAVGSDPLLTPTN
jgi:hypothetical protein